MTEKFAPEGPGDDEDDGTGYHAGDDPETDGCAFDDLDDAEKVEFCEAEIASALAKLDDAIARMAALRTEVEDPDGFVRFTLGEDGRLLSLFIHDAATDIVDQPWAGTKTQRVIRRRKRCHAAVTQRILGRPSALTRTL